METDMSWILYANALLITTLSSAHISHVSAALILKFTFQEAVSGHDLRLRFIFFISEHLADHSMTVPLSCVHCPGGCRRRSSS